MLYLPNKSVTGGLFICARGLDMLKFDEISTD